MPGFASLLVAIEAGEAARGGPRLEIPKTDSIMPLERAISLLRTA
jgi:hypothetical protein